MKLKKYLTELNELAKENPEILEYDVIYFNSRNSEDEFCLVDYLPSTGFLEDGEFVSSDEIENAICVN